MKNHLACLVLLTMMSGSGLICAQNSGLKTSASERPIPLRDTVVDRKSSDVIRLKLPVHMDADYLDGQFIQAENDRLICIATTELTCADRVNPDFFYSLPLYSGGRATAMTLASTGNETIIGTGDGEVLLFDGRIWKSLGRPRGGAIRAVTVRGDFVKATFAEPGPPDTSIAYVHKGFGWAPLPEDNDTSPLTEVDAKAAGAIPIASVKREEFELSTGGRARSPSLQENAKVVICSTSISATPSFSAAGGAGTIKIATCTPTVAWTLSVSNYSVLSVPQLTGKGSANVPFTIAPNPSSSGRTVNISITGQNVPAVVSQTGLLPCKTVTLSQSTMTFMPGDSQASVRVQTEGVCSVQVSVLNSAKVEPAWAFISSSTLTGPVATLTISVNSAEYSGRTGLFMLSGQTNVPLSVTQFGTAPGPYGSCDPSAIQLPSAITISGASQPVSFNVTAPPNCRYSFRVTSGSDFITIDPSMLSGVGTNNWHVIEFAKNLKGSTRRFAAYVIPDGSSTGPQIVISQVTGKL